MAVVLRDPDGRTSHAGFVGAEADFDDIVRPGEAAGDAVNTGKATPGSAARCYGRAP
ncbi:hypothetical protein [Streptomyces sp. NPDC017202]|uniref:hypothetical protein n=1 Tax=Streptomyces sp. NPDC017202 TaxID=3364981 RepID=UPI00379FA312